MNRPDVILTTPKATQVNESPFVKGRTIGRNGVIAIAVLFGSSFLWLAFAPLNGAVVIPAQIKVESNRKSIQHLEGGIVKDILVKSGDHVTVGQPLLNLEEVQADAAVSTIQDQLDAEIVRSARAEAERLQRSDIVLTSDLIRRSTSNSNLRTLISNERAAFQVKRKQLISQIELLREQKQQVLAEIKGLESQIVSADNNRKLISEELKMNESLEKRGFVQKTRVLQFERAMSDKEEQRGDYVAENAKAQQKLLDIDLKVIGLTDDYIKRASDELSEANRRVLELQERLRPMANALARQVITSPVAGEVVDLRIHTAGGVISAGQVLMEIVPEKSLLLVEGKVRLEDVSDLAVGEYADIQITAFKQRSTPMLTGKLTYVSADSLTDNVNGNAVPYFLAQVSIDVSSLPNLPGKLTPGMPATIFVKTRARTALDYLLQPVTDSFRRAFRER